MMSRGKVLGEIISPVVDTLVPKNIEVLLGDLVFQPPQMYIPSLGLLVVHGLMNKGISSLVIGLSKG